MDWCEASVGGVHEASGEAVMGTLVVVGLWLGATLLLAWAMGSADLDDMARRMEREERR